MSARTPPRFVPILTEVVHVAPAPAPSLHDDLVQRVTRGVMAEIEPLVREALEQQSAQQARLMEGLRADIAALVERRVTDALQPPAQD